MINTLIIEDTKLHQEKIKKIILELGYTVCGCFNNGEEAVHYVVENKNVPDLAIVDIILKSEMNGYEVARKIISETDIPIIFLTGLEDDLKDIDFDEHGIYSYLSKPYNKQELANNVATVLHRYRSYQNVKRGSEIIRNQKERLTSILEGTNVGTWEWNVQNGETIFNQRWAEIIGYTLEELSPVSIETWMEYTHPEDLEVCNRMLEKHFTGEIDYYDIECRMKHKEGHWVWVQDRGKVISWTEDGKPLWMFGTHQDITERKQMEEQLRENEDRLKLLSNHLPDSMIYQVDFGKDGSSRKFTYVNAGVERLHGVAPSEATQDASLIYGQVVEEDLPLIAQKEAECMANMSNFQMEFRVRRPSGEIRWHMVSSSPRRIANNHLVWDGFEIDITERKLMEERLHATNQRLDKAQQIAKIGDFSWDVTTGEVTWSDSLYALLKYDKDDTINFDKVNKEIHHPDDLELVNQWLMECVESGGNKLSPNEYRLIRKDDKTIFVYTTGIIERNEDGSIKVFATLQDITERKQIEERMQHQHEFQKIVANISYSFINTPTSRIDEAINNALYQIGSFFHIDRAYLFQFSSDNKSMSNTHEWCREGVEPQLEIIQNQPVEELPWIMNEIQTKEYVFISDTNTLEYEEERREFQRQGIQSLIGIPIKVEKRVAGFMGMDAVTEKMAWSEEEITLLKVISEIISSAFTKHQMDQELMQRSQEVEQLNQHLNQEMEKAHRIHSNILSKKFPSIKGISFAAFYQPTEKLGGDFYEVLQVDNKLVMYLSDISGHGLDGSMINFFVKEAIDSYITLKPDELSPESILRHLERQYRREDYPDELFICIFLAVLDLETMELIYTGAGFQDEPFVRQGNGEQAMLSTKGLFINSIFSTDKNNFQEKAITLTPGSTIFFNTDGLTEQGESGVFYRDRLPQVFYENAHLPPDGISQAVVEDFRLFNNGSLQGNDHITFLILQVEPENTRYQFELATDFGELEHLRDKIVGILPNVEESEVLIGCLNELVANAMEHGNKMDPTTKVTVEFLVSDDYIQASVEDEGAGFNWRDKRDKPLELEGLTERGRGIAITGILCDSLFYNDQGNKATCVVQFRQGGGVCR